MSLEIKKNTEGVVWEIEDILKKTKFTVAQSETCKCTINGGIDQPSGEETEYCCSKYCRRVLMKLGFLIKKLIITLSGPESSFSKEDIQINFKKLLKLVYVENDLDITMIYMSLFSYSLSFLTDFCTAESDFVVELNILTPITNLKDLLCKKQSQRVLFLHIVRFTHALRLIYSSLLSNYDSATGESLSSLLQLSEWIAPIHLLSFLHHWSSTKNKLGLAPILETILPRYANSSDSLISIAANEKFRHMSIVKWCLECYPSINIPKLLKLLHDHSTLYALQASMPIHKISYHKIKEILFKISQQDNSDLSFDTSGDYTYSGYYILWLSLNSIVAGIEMDKSLFVWQRMNHKLCKLHKGSNQRTEIDINSCKKFYKQHLCKPLERIMYIFREIYSIPFCLEILENIFSLLFIQHTSFSDEARSNSSWDENETNSPSSVKQEMDGFPSNSSVLSSFDDTFPLTNSQLNIAISTRSVSLAGKLESYIPEDKGQNAAMSGWYIDQNRKTFLSKATTSNSDCGIGLGVNHNLKQFESARFPCNNTSLILLENCTSSELSSSSSVNDFPNCGYIMNSLVVWDHLLLLQELVKSLKDRKGDYYKSKYSILLSIEEQEVLSRLQDLEKRVDCALWRLKVLIPKYQNRSFGSENEISPYINGSLFCSASSVFKYDNLDSTLRKKSKISKKKLSVNTNKSRSNSQFNQTGILYYLLSTPQNLLNIALVNNNISGAQEVALKYDIRSCREKQELSLMKSLNVNIPKMENISSLVEKHKLVNSNVNKKVSEKSASDKMEKDTQLQSRDVAISCLISQTLNIFMLENPDINDIDDIQEITLFDQFFQKLILTDISMTSKLSQDIAVKLLTEAFSCREIAVHGTNSKAFLSLQSFFQSTSQLMNLFTLLQETEKEDYIFCLNSLMSNLKWNPMTLFLSKCPLTLASLKSTQDEWVQILTHVTNFLEKYNRPRPIPKFQGFQKVSDGQDFINLYVNLQTKLEAASSLEMINLAKSMNLPYNYLQHFLDYLKTLDSVVKEYVSTSSNVKLSIDKNLFSLLNEKPTTIFGDLLFVSKIEPLKLETVSEHLQLDLLTVLVSYVLPPVPPNLLKIEEPVETELFEKFGCVQVDNYFVLNASKLCGTKAVHGDLAVIDLLSTLLDRLRDIEYEHNVFKGEKIITKYSAPLFLKDSQIKTILLETCDIGCIDLQKLQPGKESLVFFLNLANLMFIHAVLLNSLLFSSENNCSGIFSNSCLEVYLSLKHTGYIVGQLGFVSLYDVLYRILKQPIIVGTIAESAILPLLKGITRDDELPNFLASKYFEDILPEVPHELIFIVTQIVSSSPKINVYYPDTFEDGLSAAISEYFSHIVVPQYSINIKEAEKNLILSAFFTRSEGVNNAISILKKYTNDESFPNIDFLYRFSQKKTNSKSFRQKPFNFCADIVIEYSSDDIVPHSSPLKVNDSKKKVSLTSKEIIIPSLSKEIVSYVQDKCPVINVFLKKIMKNAPNYSKDIFIDKCVSSTCLDNMMNLSDSSQPAQSSDRPGMNFFDNRKYSSVLSEIEMRLKVITKDSFMQQSDNIAHKSMINLFHYLASLPTILFFNNVQLNYIWDQVLANILSVKSDSFEDPHFFFFLIKDANLKFQVLKDYYLNWPIDSTIDCLHLLKGDKTLGSVQKCWIEQKLSQMELYSEILRCTDVNMKNKILLMGAEQVLEYLNEHKQYSLLVKYAQCNDLLDKYYSLTMSSSLLDCLDHIEPNFMKAQQIFNNLPSDLIGNIIPDLLKKISFHSTRIFLIDIYLQHSYKADGSSKTLRDPEINFRENVFSLRQELMGLILVEEVASKNFNKTQLYPLITKPHLILEQWIMNMKLDNVRLGIECISKHLDAMTSFSDVGEISVEFLSWNQFHSIVEKYAMKALEMSGIQVNVQRQKLKMKEINEQFVIPLNIPSKFDWQPNSAVDACPLCQTGFSLFCRRHHCRRCGRVVCAACSMKRFKIDGYSAPVRICSYCFKSLCPKNVKEYEGSPSSTPYSNDIEADIADDSLNFSDHSESGWYFTTEPNHILSVREEFSYDGAPSLSLFLAVLSLHKNDTKAAICTLKLIHKLFLFVIDASTAEFSEVDTNFVLRMIQTLVASAKLRFGKVADYDGISLCEYYNQWADMLQLLINSKSVSLIPMGCLRNMLSTGELQQRHLSGLFVDVHRIQQNLDQERKFLKIIRDNLVKNEKWQQALNLSTKAGFETTGVWGAIAMASLKAGDFAAAREHFSKVLIKRKDKNIYLKSTLLVDIIAYLETQPQLFEMRRSMKDNSLIASHSDCLTGSAFDALIVSQTLNSLNRIANGDLNGEDNDTVCNILPVRHSLDPLLRRECEYYLTLYGCHRMYLQFLLRHKRNYDAVRYSMQNNVPGEIFAEEVLMKSFRKGQFDFLWKVIKEVDLREKWSPSILISSCKWLEKNKFLHCLLEINKALKDRLRSAIILIRLYTQFANCFSELMNRKQYLTDGLLNLQAYLNTIPLNEAAAKLYCSPGLKGLRLHSSSWVVNQQIHLCNFQELVIKHLCDVEVKDVKLKNFILVVQSIIHEERPQKQTKNNFQIPTVFGKEERMTVCVITICHGENIATGLNLIYRLVEINLINPKELLGATLKVLIKLENHKDMAPLIRGILEWGLIPDSQIKAILWPSIIWAGKNAPESTTKILVNFLSNSNDKLEAYVEAGLLKLAYFQIVERGKKEDFEKLLEIATKKKDQMVIFNCNKWLKNYSFKYNLKQ